MKTYEYKVVYGSGEKYWSRIFQELKDAHLFADSTKRHYGCSVQIRRREVKAWSVYCDCDTGEILT